jgi:hypothetical protein
MPARILDIPDDAIWISFGALMDGSGLVQFDDAAFEVVGTDVPLTKPVQTITPDTTYGSRVAPSYASAGDIPLNLGFDIVPLAVSNLQSGKVRALAVCSAERVKALPNVPTIAEAGLPGMEAGAWFGLFAPAGTPAGAIAWLNREAKKAFESPQISERFSGQGAMLPLGPPEAFGAHVAAETERWGALIRRAGIRME